MGTHGEAWFFGDGEEDLWVAMRFQATLKALSSHIVSHIVSQSLSESSQFLTLKDLACI